MLLITMTARMVLILMALAFPHTARAGWQDMPDTVQLQPMGDTLQVNGTPMQVRAFASTLALDALLQDVETRWRRSPGEVKRSVNSAWTVLNQTVGAQHRSFQVRQSSASTIEGFVALTSPSATRKPKLAVHLPPDMTAVSIIDSVDQGRASQQVIAVSKRSMTATAASLEASLKASGWERHRFKAEPSGIVFAANKGRQQFDATLSAQPNGSIVMMNTLLN
ncbi:hypothetical protein INH39_17495 [Massilia violaceinigra]|uniref:Uncharacterized protein n=1 Tax=Massilia violaceinigra TaxID=2045208 RepID=A0ABY4A0U0_9BURK|nr:hypothetical protein [Massilia violaceinigra]UOD27329.1 hypothetical protein INH39_17495 [Massilia violaceinigra]